jgi:type VI secretion system protein ImpH
VTSQERTGEERDRFGLSQAMRRVEVAKRLAEAPHRFGFFQALRRLECLYREGPRIGEATRLGDEYLRLGQDPSLAFAPSTLSSWEPGAGARPPRLGVYFLGLFGPNGPLPLHLTEYARDRMHNAGDPTFARFADLFHHRMLSFCYRAWAQAQPAVSFDRPESDRFGAYVASLMGLGAPEFLNRDAAPDLARLYYCGHFSLQTKNADGLRDLLADYFEVPVAIAEFRGSWVEIEEPERLRLGESEITGTLGVSTIVGSRVWDRQLTFRVVGGPMGLEDYERLLPDGSSLDRMAALVRTYIGDEFIWDLQLILKREEIPMLELGRAGRLGWTTWLLSEPARRDSDDLVLDPARTLESSPLPAPAVM